MSKKRYQSFLSKSGERMIGIRRINKLYQQPDVFQHQVLSVQNSIKAMFLFGSSEFLYSRSLRIKTIDQLLPQAPVVKKKNT